MLFSSATSVLGSPGQANYVAANAFLDGLAHYRHRQGLPALAINWGAWAEVGMATQTNQTEQLAKQGILAFPPQLGVQLLERILATSAVQVTALRADWPRLRQRFTLPLLQDLAAVAEPAAAAGKVRTGDSLRRQLHALAPTERRAAIAELLQKQLAQVLRTPLHKLDPQQPLSEAGHRLADDGRTRQSHRRGTGHHHSSVYTAPRPNYRWPHGAGVEAAGSVRLRRA